MRRETSSRADRNRRYKAIYGDTWGGKSPAMNSGRACIYLSKNAKLIFRGHANISEGTVLRCDKNGIIEFGKDFYCNCNCYFRTSSKISFGDDCAVGWNCTINLCWFAELL